MKRLWQVIEENVGGLLHVTRYPISLKVARINLGAWFFALVFALTSIVLFISDGSWDSFWLWFNVAVGTLDAYMLRRSWLGYCWATGRRARRRA